MENETMENEEVVAPVIEKVSLAEIKLEQESEDYEEIAEVLDEFLQLTPEEKNDVLSGLFD